MDKIQINQKTLAYDNVTTLAKNQFNSQNFKNTQHTYIKNLDQKLLLKLFLTISILDSFKNSNTVCMNSLGLLHNTPQNEITIQVASFLEKTTFAQNKHSPYSNYIIISPLSKKKILKYCGLSKQYLSLAPKNLNLKKNKKRYLKTLRGYFFKRLRKNLLKNKSIAYKIKALTIFKNSCTVNTATLLLNYRNLFKLLEDKTQSALYHFKTRAAFSLAPILDKQYTRTLRPEIHKKMQADCLFFKTSGIPFNRDMYLGRLEIWNSLVKNQLYYKYLPHFLKNFKPRHLRFLFNMMLNTDVENKSIITSKIGTVLITDFLTLTNMVIFKKKIKYSLKKIGRPLMRMKKNQQLRSFKWV